MIKDIEKLLYDSDVDLSSCDIIRDDPAIFVVRERLGGLRAALALLFGVPCLVLIYHALSGQGIYLILAPVFCPPLAFLGLAYGFVRQQKAFVPSLGIASKSYRLMAFERTQQIDLPKAGLVSTYRRFSTVSRSGGGYYRYYVAIDGIEGMGFSIAKDELIRDRFAKDLAGFLKYNIKHEDD